MLLNKSTTETATTALVYPRGRGTGRQRQEGRERRRKQRRKGEEGHRETKLTTPHLVKEPTDRRRDMRPGRAVRRRSQKRTRRGKRQKGTGKERPHRGHWARSLAWGGRAFPRVKRGPPGIHS